MSFKGSAIAAVGVAADGILAGCGQTATSTQPSGGAKEGVTGKTSFETPPTPIADEDIKETITADVVVIGAGISGLMTALEAAKAGSKTVLIEKYKSYTFRGLHNGAINSKLQKKLGISIDKTKVVNDLARTMSNKVDKNLLKLWADKSGEVMDNLLDMAATEGITVTMMGKSVENDGYREYDTAHIFGQSKLAAMLEKNAKSKGVDIRYDTPAAQLIRDAKGRVSGVIAGIGAGNYLKLNAKKGVVLCTGDYGNNEEMQKRYCPASLDVDSNVYPTKTNNGDGHKMGLWIGAPLQKVESHVGMIHNNTAPILSSNPWLRVNALGERYENEDVSVPCLCSGIQMQPGSKAWSIYDAKWVEDASKMSGGFGRIIKVTDANQKSFEEAVNKGTIIKAETLNELAQKMGVPVDAFMATVTRYNELAKAKKDLDFGKSSNNLSTIEEAPFYAAKQRISLLVTLGGFNVNLKLQVLDIEGKVIPGLYAAGNTVGNLFASDYPVHAPGLSHGCALTFGSIAGKNISAEQV